LAGFAAARAAFLAGDPIVTGQCLCICAQACAVADLALVEARCDARAAAATGPAATEAQALQVMRAAVRVRQWLQTTCCVLYCILGAWGDAARKAAVAIDHAAFVLSGAGTGGEGDATGTDATPSGGGVDEKEALVFSAVAGDLATWAHRLTQLAQLGLEGSAAEGAGTCADDETDELGLPVPPFTLAAASATRSDTVLRVAAIPILSLLETMTAPLSRKTPFGAACRALAASVRGVFQGRDARANLQSRIDAHGARTQAALGAQRQFVRRIRAAPTVAEAAAAGAEAERAASSLAQELRRSAGGIWTAALRVVQVAIEATVVLSGEDPIVASPTSPGIGDVATSIRIATAVDGLHALRVALVAARSPPPPAPASAASPTGGNFTLMAAQVGGAAEVKRIAAAARDVTAVLAHIVGVRVSDTDGGVSGSGALHVASSVDVGLLHALFALAAAGCDGGGALSTGGRAAAAGGAPQPPQFLPPPAPPLRDLAAYGDDRDGNPTACWAAASAATAAALVCGAAPPAVHAPPTPAAIADGANSSAGLHQPEAPPVPSSRLATATGDLKATVDALTSVLQSVHATTSAPGSGALIVPEFPRLDVLDVLRSTMCSIRSLLATWCAIEGFTGSETAGPSTLAASGMPRPWVSAVAASKDLSRSLATFLGGVSVAAPVVAGIAAAASEVAAAYSDVDVFVADDDVGPSASGATAVGFCDRSLSLAGVEALLLAASGATRAAAIAVATPAPLLLFDRNSFAPSFARRHGAADKTRNGAYSDDDDERALGTAEGNRAGVVSRALVFNAPPSPRGASPKARGPASTPGRGGKNGVRTRGLDLSPVGDGDAPTSGAIRLRLVPSYTGATATDGDTVSFSIEGGQREVRERLVVLISHDLDGPLGGGAALGARPVQPGTPTRSPTARDGSGGLSPVAGGEGSGSSAPASSMTSQGARIFYEWDAAVPFRLRLPQPRTALPSGGGAGKPPAAQSDTSGLEKGPAVTASKPPPATARRVEIHALLVDPAARAAVEADLAAGVTVGDNEGDGVLHYVLATARTSVFVYPKREEHDGGMI
jgi:hypothetical protein